MAKVRYPNVEAQSCTDLGMLEEREHLSEGHIIKQEISIKGGNSASTSLRLLAAGKVMEAETRRGLGGEWREERLEKQQN